MTDLYRCFLYILLFAVCTGALYFVQLHSKKKDPIHTPDAFLQKKARVDYFQRMLLDPSTGEIPVAIRKQELAYAATLPARDHVTEKTTSVANVDWIEAGPNDVGGRTRALAVDRTNSNTVLAGGVASGIWKSTDRGATWELKTDPTLLTGVSFITQDPRPGHTSTWYALTGEQLGSNGDRGRRTARFGEGFYMSVDNGDSWTRVVSAENPTAWDSIFDFGLKVLVSPVSGHIFFASQGFGIHRLDAPTSIPIPMIGRESQAEWSDFDIAPDGTIIAVISKGFKTGASETSGVFYSTDNGDSWEDITPEGYATEPERSVIAFAPSNPSKAYLWTFTGEISTNTNNAFGFVEVMQFYAFVLPSGTSEDRSAFLPDFDGPLGDLYTQNNYDMVMAVNPYDADDVFIGGTNLYRSKNGFSIPIDKINDKNKTWVGGYSTIDNGQDIYPDHHPDQHALFFDPFEEGVLWSGHDGGLSLATNIDSTINEIDWKDKNNGYNVTQFYHVAIAPEAGDDRIIGGTQDNGTPFLRFDSTLPIGAPSSQVSRGDGGYTYLGPTYGISSSTGGALFELTYNEFTGFIPPGRQMPLPNANGQLFINPFAVDKINDSFVYYPAGNELWRGRNVPGAPTWTQLSNATVPSGYSITALATGKRSVDQETFSTLYFGASGRNLVPALYRLDEASTSTDVPANISILTLPSNAYIHHIATNPLDGNELLVVASNYNIIGLYHSKDAGTTFTPVEGNLEGTGDLPGPSLRSATILPVNDTVLYVVGTSTGVYSTTFLNEGNTIWRQEGVTEIGHTIVESVTSRVSDGWIAVGTHGRGIFIGTPISTVSNEPLLLPVVDSGVKLEQNYPNPFRSRTVISYTLPQPGIVSLRVFDSAGRHVQTLLNQQLQQTGSYSFPYDSGTLASGTYIYELEVRPMSSSNGLIKESKVMLLQK